MAGDDRGIGKQTHHVRGGRALSGVGAKRLKIGGEHLIGAEQALDAHSGSDVGQLEQMIEIGDRKGQLTEHPVGTVDQGEAFLLGQNHRFETMGSQCRCRIGEFTVGGADGTFTDDCHRHMSQWCQISRASEAAVFVHHRGDACGE